MSNPGEPWNILTPYANGIDHWAGNAGRRVLSSKLAQQQPGAYVENRAESAAGH